MEVNLTIFVQALQFFCSYFFLYRYFFTPVYKAIIAKETLALKLLEELEIAKNKEQILLSSLQQDNKKQQKKLFEQLEQLDVSIENKVFYQDVQSDPVDVVEQKDILYIESLLVDRLSKVVKHD